MAVKLIEICSFQSGGTPSRTNPEYFHGTIPWITTVALNGRTIGEESAVEWITEKAITESAAKIVPEKSIMVGTRVGVGKVAVNAIPMSTSQDIISLVGIDESQWDKGFLCKFLQSKESYLKGQARGATIKGIKIDALSTLEVPELPLSEQKSIVRTLDTILDVIASRQTQLSALDDLIKARFVEMFGDPETNPKEWKKKPLAEVITAANNGMARRGNDEHGSIVMRLVELQDGYIDYTNPNRIVLNEAEKKRYLLRDKDFLFARVNGNPDNVGRCAVFTDIGEPVYHNDHIIRVHLDDNAVDGEFASALLNSTYGKRQLKNQIKTSAGQYTVSQDGIGAIVAILPPIELQRKFSAFVSQVDKSKSAIQKSLAETQTLFDNLMQQYFG